MPSFGEVRTLLSAAGYPDVGTILYGCRSEAAPVADEELSNAIIETMCQYGPVVLEFDQVGELYAVTVMVSPGAATAVPYSEVIEVLKREGYEYPEYTTIVYTPDECLEGNPKWAQRPVYTSCIYGVVTIAFNEHGALEWIEVS